MEYKTKQKKKKRREKKLRKSLLNGGSNFGHEKNVGHKNWSLLKRTTNDNGPGRKKDGKKCAKQI